MKDLDVPDREVLECWKLSLMRGQRSELGQRLEAQNACSKTKGKDQAQEVSLGHKGSNWQLDLRPCMFCYGRKFVYVFLIF